MNLKECPFCGGNAFGGEFYETHSDESVGKYYVVFCESCGAAFPGKEYEDYDTIEPEEKQRVNDLWNTRVASPKETPKKVEYGTDETAGGELYQYSRCPCCYNADLIENQKYCDECGQALDWSENNEK